MTETVHRCPPDGGPGITPCCGRTPFELPHDDRIASDPALVTCGSATPSAAVPAVIFRPPPE